jgi:hypothetical protein
VIESNLDEERARDAKVNEIGRVDGIPQYLDQLKHEFQKKRRPIHAHIAIDENTLVNSFSMVLLLRIFGVKVELVAATLSETTKSHYLSRWLNEDPCYLFSCMNRQDAGWCNIWQRT